MSTRLILPLILSACGSFACRDLTFHSVCETTPEDPRCKDDVGPSDTLADASDASDVADAVGDAADSDAGCTGECTPGASETVGGGTCGALEVYQHSCGTDCKWGAPACLMPKGWTAIASSPTGFVGRNAPAVWSGKEMIVWGGASGTGDALADGAKFDLSKNAWTVQKTSGLAPRFGHTAVWTGSRSTFIVWGGEDKTAARFNDGAIYYFDDKWSSVAASPLAKRTDHGAVWSSATSEMIVWGGLSDTGVNLADGAAYSPVTDSWTLLPAAPIAGRNLHLMFWSGSDVVIWGGRQGDKDYLGDGARYDPVGKKWTVLPVAPAAWKARAIPSAAAVADGFFAFGGFDIIAPDFIGRGDALLLKAGAWTSSTGPGSLLSFPERSFSSVWCADSACWAWSGAKISKDFATTTLLAGGARYDLAKDSWSLMPTAGEPTPRARAVVVWTGSSAIMWSGQDPGGTVTSGAVFTP